MIDPIKSVGALKSISLAGVDRVRERIAEIEKRFGIAGDGSFQSTFEREMKKAQRADRARAAQSSGRTTQRSSDVGNVERAADAVSASNAGNSSSVSDELKTLKAAEELKSVDALREAELVSEFDELEKDLTLEQPKPNVEPEISQTTLPGEEALNPFASLEPAENPVPTRETVREPLNTVVESAFFERDLVEDEEIDTPFASVPQTTEEMIEAAAAKYSIDPNLVKELAAAESDWNQNAISPVGAIGVMQLMPETAEVLGVDPYDEQENIEGGAKYLRQMLDTFDGNVRNAVAAYNAGPGAVKRYGGVPPYSETQNYVGRVLDLYE